MVASAEHDAAEITSAAVARALRHGAILAVAAGTVVAFLLAVAPLVFGSDFERTVGLGLIMLPGAIALALGRVMIALLIGIGRADLVLAIGGTVVPAALVAFLLTVPGGGPTAAAIVCTVAYLLTTIGAALALGRAGHGFSASSLRPRRADFAEYAGLLRRRGRDRVDDQLG